MIRDVGNIELCELLKTEPKTQCTVCLSYWNIGILFCTCGHFLHKERGVNRQFISYSMDLLSLPEYVFKKGRPHGHRYGKKTGRQGILYGSPTEEKMQEKVFPRKESMTDSYEIQNSVVEWLKIETKNFVDDGMFLRMKITLTIWLHKNTLSIRANGGLIQISKVLILYDWRRDLISNKHCLPCIDCNEKQKETHKCPLILTQVNNGHIEFFFYVVELARFMVDSLSFRKSRWKMHQVLNERGDLLIAVSGKILLDKTFLNSTYFVTDGSFTADGGLL